MLYKFGGTVALLYLYLTIPCINSSPISHYYQLFLPSQLLMNEPQWTIQTSLSLHSIFQTYPPIEPTS